MATWIDEAQKAAVAVAADDDGDGAEEPEESGPQDNLPSTRPPHRPRKWTPITLAILFGTSPRTESLCTRISRRAREQEEQYMQVMAELEVEETSPDAGAIEIEDSEVYGE